jgi:hypothetical protein
MKIRELFENFSPKLKEEDKEEQSTFDICEDLIYYMHNNDDFYRRHYYPHLIKCKNAIKKGQRVTAESFAPVVKHAYECYIAEFNDMLLPESLEQEDFSKVCEKIKEDEVENIKKKMY